ncbi:hypothetical protein EBB07_30625 [Paenibacillaceae bacterium]|nr:hypothetical protein EBB07_30625 [Paenibacillaceae bacterium]
MQLNSRSKFFVGCPWQLRAGSGDRCGVDEQQIFRKIQMTPGCTVAFFDDQVKNALEYVIGYVTLFPGERGIMHGNEAVRGGLSCTSTKTLPHR